MADPFENKGFRDYAGVRNGLYFLPHGESTSFTSMGSLVRVQLSPPQEKLEKSGFSFFLPPSGGTHFPYTKFGVGKVVVHLISQTFDVNEIAGRCKQGAGNKRSAPSQALSDNITGRAKKQKCGAVRSASR